MSRLTMLGCALLAATAFLTYASTASATVLTSPSGTEYTGTFTATATSSLKLEAGFATDTCTTSTMSGKVSTNTTVAALGFSTLEFGGCSFTTDLLNKGSIEVASGGEVLGSGSEITVSTLGTSCVYGPGFRAKLGRLIRRLGAAILILEGFTKLISGGFLCANPASWTGEYTVTTPTGLLID